MFKHHCVKEAVMTLMTKNVFSNILRSALFACCVFALSIEAYANELHVSIRLMNIEQLRKDINIYVSRDHSKFIELIKEKDLAGFTPFVLAIAVGKSNPIYALSVIKLLADAAPKTVLEEWRTMVGQSSEFNRQVERHLRSLIDAKSTAISASDAATKLLSSISHATMAQVAQMAVGAGAGAGAGITESVRRGAMVGMKGSVGAKAAEKAKAAPTIDVNAEASASISTSASPAGSDSKASSPLAPAQIPSHSPDAASVVAVESATVASDLPPPAWPTSVTSPKSAAVAAPTSSASVGVTVPSSDDEDDCSLSDSEDDSDGEITPLALSPIPADGAVVRVVPGGIPAEPEAIAVPTASAMLDSSVDAINSEAWEWVH
jgi:hypothetical protein